MNIRGLAKDNGVSRAKTNLYGLAGFLAFPLILVGSVVLGVFIAPLASIIPVVALVAWILLLHLLYKGVHLAEPSRTIGLTVALTLIAFIAEFILALGLFLKGGGTGVAIYLGLAVIMPIILVNVIGHRRHRRARAAAAAAAPTASATTVMPGDFKEHPGGSDQPQG